MAHGNTKGNPDAYQTLYCIKIFPIFQLISAQFDMRKEKSWQVYENGEMVFR